MRDRGLEDGRNLPTSPSGGGAGCERSHLTAERGSYLPAFGWEWDLGSRYFVGRPRRTLCRWHPPGPWQPRCPCLGSVLGTRGLKERLLFCVALSLGMKGAWERSCRSRPCRKASLSRSVSQVWQERFADIGGTKCLLLAPVRRIVHLF